MDSTRVPCLEPFSNLRKSEWVMLYGHRELSAGLWAFSVDEKRRRLRAHMYHIQGAKRAPGRDPAPPARSTQAFLRTTQKRSVLAYRLAPAGHQVPGGTGSRAVADWTRWLELTDTFWRHSAPGGVECRLWDWSPVFSVSQISNRLENPNWRILGGGNGINYISFGLPSDFFFIAVVAELPSKLYWSKLLK